MTERRYTEDEVAAIFERATEAQQTSRHQVSSGTGMTLAELQEIGREVGIAPATIANAALALDQGGQPAARRFLGLPIGVGRTIELGRRLTDEEWERLVVDLRETFDARGTVRSDGSFRQWTNGNLQALLEPTPSGDRLRMRTMRGQSRAMMTAGLGVFGMGLVTMLVAFLSNGAADAAAVSILSLSGLGMFGLGALRLPGWAKIRSRQMEGVASRLALPLPPASTGEPT
jgi:hypothetical protein